MRFSIRLLIVFVTIFTLGISLFSVFQHRSSTDYILTMELDNLVDRGLMVKDQLDRYLVHAGVVVNQLALNSDITGFIHSRQYEDTREIHTLLDDIRSTNPREFSVVFLLDEAGVCRASTDRRFVGTDYSFRPYYQNLVGGETDLFISDYSIGLRSLIPGVFLSTPVKNEDGSLAGVVVLKIDGSYLQNIIELNTLLAEPEILEEPLGSGTNRIRPVSIPVRRPEVFIINRDGIVILHTRRELVYRSVTPLDGETVAELDASRQFLGRAIPSMDDWVLGELHDQSLESREVTATVYRDAEEGRWMVLALVPINHFSWSIGVSLDYTEFRFLSRALFVRTVMLLGFIIIVLTLASFYITGMITRPVTTLTEVIADVKDKNWDKRVTIQSNDEFSYLARRFNELLDIIESYSQEMEQRVESRTREVLALQRENTRLRIIEEREQLYSDMHDSIGARLTNINICNTVASSELHKNPVMVEDMLKRIDSNCEVAIDEMKRLISRNSNLIEDEPLLGDAMVEQIRNRLAIRGIVLREKVNVPPEAFDGRRSHQIKEILEELVSNVLKHSQAGAVHLNAGIKHDALILEFSDDGRGLGSGEDKSGFGLRNIKKRLERLDGRYTMHSTPGRGVRFHITVPVGRREDTP